LSIAREGCDQAFDRLHGIRSRQGREHKVSGFGSIKGKLAGLALFEFPDGDHIRYLPQRRAHRMSNARRVTVQFPLMNGRLLVVMQKFDRVFNGYDVTFGRAVDVVDQSRQSRTLSGSAWTSD